MSLIISVHDDQPAVSIVAHATPLSSRGKDSGYVDVQVGSLSFTVYTTRLLDTLNDLATQTRIAHTAVIDMMNDADWHPDTVVRIAE